MKKPFHLFKSAVAVAAGALILASCGTGGTRNYTQYVDPFIGTGDHGHVFLGASVPRGMVQLGPTQLTQGWDWVSGYHYSDSTVVGFGHLHLSGTGIGDLGDISFMPVTGDVPMAYGTAENPQEGFLSLFSHERESARPGFYSVHLDRYGIDVELTASNRTGFHKYDFPEGSDAKVIIDLNRGIGWDRPTQSNLVLEDEYTVSGYRFSRGWAPDQKVYFTAVFSKSIADMELFDFIVEPQKNAPAKTTLNGVDGDSLASERVFGRLSFDSLDGEPLFIKVGTSAVSVENAKLNMKEEIPGWDFAEVAREADRLWNEELARIEFKTDNETDRRIFYTAMYHYHIAPSVFQDVNGDYRGSDGKTYNDKTFTNYTLFSLWDTYRAAHPLMTIIDPEVSRDVVKSFMNIYDQQGKLPVWHLVGNETDCMVGNPGVIVLADLVLKGYVQDEEAAFEAMKTSAMLDERSMEWLKQYGYIPYDVPRSYESVGKCMEYAIADWTIAEVAKKLGKTEDEKYFRERSKSYKHYFDPQTEFIRGLSSDGKFIEPLNPTWSAHQGLSVYTEGNTWQYTFLVPHDVYGLIDLFPSEGAFVEKLDALFTTEGDLGPEAPPDVTGLIGQYAHGNEPSHHVTYMYAHVGQQWKTAEKVREILTTLYFDAPAGLCGNEDVGQMSAWYILSSMGFYQASPAGGEYIFGSPLMDEAVIHLPEGRTFRITAKDNSPENIYIQSVKLNGKDYPYSYINYADIMKGGKLEFSMGPQPSQFGAATEYRPK